MGEYCLDECGLIGLYIVGDDELDAADRSLDRNDDDEAGIIDVSDEDESGLRPDIEANEYRNGVSLFGKFCNKLVDVEDALL